MLEVRSQCVNVNDTASFIFDNNIKQVVVGVSGFSFTFTYNEWISQMKLNLSSSFQTDSPSMTVAPMCSLTSPPGDHLVASDSWVWVTALAWTEPGTTSAPKDVLLYTCSGLSGANTMVDLSTMGNTNLPPAICQPIISGLSFQPNPPGAPQTFQVSSLAQYVPSSPAVNVMGIGDMTTNASNGTGCPVAGTLVDVGLIALGATSGANVYHTLYTVGGAHSDGATFNYSDLGIPQGTILNGMAMFLTGFSLSYPLYPADYQGGLVGLMGPWEFYNKASTSPPHTAETISVPISNNFMFGQGGGQSCCPFSSATYAVLAW